MTLYHKAHWLIKQPRIWQAVFYPLLGVILFLATTDQSYPVPAASNDKVNHFMAFVSLGVLLRWSHPRLNWFPALVLLGGYGLAIELIQGLLPYRHLSFFDLLADMAGALVGLWLGWGLLRGALTPASKKDQQPD